MDKITIPHLGDILNDSIFSILQKPKKLTMHHQSIAGRNKFITLFIGLIFLLFGHTLNGQIIIESTLYSNKIGKTYKDVLYETNIGITNQLSEIIQALGPDQIYDFSNLNYVDSTEVIETFFNIDPNDPILQDPNIDGSNLLVKTTLPPVTGGSPDTIVQYRYLTLTNSELLMNASLTFFDIDQDNELDTLLQWFSPSSLILPFPIHSNSIWIDSTSINQTFGGSTFTSAIIIDTSTVEGWGKVITPQGTVDALRVHHKSIDKIPNTPISEVSNDLTFGTIDENLTASIVLEDGRAFYNVRTYLDETSSTYDTPQLIMTSLQNYPNPFSNLTTIEFELEKKSQVSIRLLTMDGSLHSVISSEIHPSGKNTVEWNSNDLISGHYILEVRVNNQVQRKLITCLK